MRKTMIAAFAILALSFGVTACGSSDDSGDTPSEDALTKAELTAQADALCTEYDSEVAQKINEVFNNQEPSKEEIVQFTSDEIVPLYQEQLTKFQELEPDESSADAWNNIVDTLESDLSDLEANPDALVNDENPFADATAAAKDFGLEVCGAG